MDPDENCNDIVSIHVRNYGFVETCVVLAWAKIHDCFKKDWPL